MYNKKTLSKATAELDKAKAPKKPKDIITDPMGQWKYPGLPTRIPGNDITMKGVGYPVLGVANNGQRKIMLPGADYTFPGADYVDEYPQMKKGGAKKKRKTKSIMGINKVMQKGPLFQDYSKKIYDPNVDYFQDGGIKTVKSKDGTVTNTLINDKGDKVMQVKTKDGKYHEKIIPRKQHFDTLNKLHSAVKGPIIDRSEPTLEERVDYNLGHPQGKAQNIAQRHAEKGEGPIDNVRHPFAGRYSAEALYKMRKENTPWAPDWMNKSAAWVDANMLGIGHEASTLFKDERPWSTKLREAGEDIYNNAVGVNVGLSNKNAKQKTNELLDKSFYNQIPDGMGEEHPFHNKWVDPYDKKEDGGYIEADLTDDEIEEYRKGGFIVEDISVPELNQAQKGGAKDKFATHIGEDGTVGTTSVHTDKKGNITTKVQDSKGITHYKVKTKDGKVFYKQDASTTYPKSNSVSQENYKPDPREIEMNDGALQSVDDVWTLPIGMTSAGLKGTVGLVKGLTSLGRNALKSSLVQAGRAGLKKSLIKSLPGSSINNLVGSEFAGTALTDIVTGKVAEPWKKANKSGKVSDYVDAFTENMYTALDAYPLYKPVSKGLKHLTKLSEIHTPLENTHSILPENMYRSGIGGMDMSRYEIKNPDFYTQMLNTYSNKVLSPTNKKFYTGLIETIKKQNGLVTERQYNELQRLKSGNFNFGKKAYKAGGIVADLTHAEIQDYIKQGYIVEDVD